MAVTEGLQAVDCGGGVYACGMTALVPLPALLEAVHALGIRTVFCMALTADRRLQAAAPEHGFTYVHSVLRAGSRPSWARRLVGDIARAAKAGRVLVAGETLGGRTLALARSAATGQPMTTRGVSAPRGL
jgi:hypothetical protein